LEQFAYVASHDLKAPLRGIENLVDWLSEDLGDTLSENNQRYMRLLHGRTARMESLLNGLLEYSRIGRKNVAHEIIDSNTLIADVISLLALQDSIEITVNPKMPALKTPKVPLEMVFRNLIGNAAKHGDQNNAKIDIEYVDNEEFAQFTIKDNGPGIPLQYHERVFGLFQTLKPRDEVEGTGIGLALVKRAVEYHGGYVKIISDPKKTPGTSFQFTWPKNFEEKT